MLALIACATICLIVGIYVGFRIASDVYKIHSSSMDFFRTENNYLRETVNLLIKCFERNHKQVDSFVEIAKDQNTVLFGIFDQMEELKLVYREKSNSKRKVGKK